MPRGYDQILYILPPQLVPSQTDRLEVVLERSAEGACHRDAGRYREFVKLFEAAVAAPTRED